MATITNISLNTASITNVEHGQRLLTWEDATFTWAEASGTWANPIGMTNIALNTATISNVALS